MSSTCSPWRTSSPCSEPERHARRQRQRDLRKCAELPARDDGIGRPDHQPFTASPIPVGGATSSARSVPAGVPAVTSCAPMLHRPTTTRERHRPRRPAARPTERARIALECRRSATHPRQLCRGASPPAILTRPGACAAAPLPSATSRSTCALRRLELSALSPGVALSGYARRLFPAEGEGRRPPGTRRPRRPTTPEAEVGHRDPERPNESCKPWARAAAGRALATPSASPEGSASGAAAPAHQPKPVRRRQIHLARSTPANKSPTLPKPAVATTVCGPAYTWMPAEPEGNRHEDHALESFDDDDRRDSPDERR